MAKLTPCKSCGAMIAKSAKVCPNCGAKKRHPFKGLLKWVIILVIVGGVIGAIAGTAGGDKTKNEKLKEVEAAKIQKDELGIQYIVGSYKNVSGKDISYVQITFALYDKSGAQIGTAVDNINNLTKDSVWKFKAVPLVTDEWTKFKITEITAW